MLPYIVACRDDVIKKDNDDDVALMDSAISIHLANLMQANQGSMSCARGTPRGFREIFDTFLHIKYPAPPLTEHERIIESVSSVISNIVKVHLKKVANRSAQRNERPNYINGHIIRICDSMSRLGSDNARELFLNNGIVKANSLLKTFNNEDLHLRNVIMNQSYPTFEGFEKAVIKNIQPSPDDIIELSKTDKTYLNLQYVAISNEAIRKRIDGIRDTETNKVSKDYAIKTAPQKILDAINVYKENTNINLNKIKLKNTLQQTAKLLLPENFDLDARDKAIDYLIGNVKNYRNNMTTIEAKNILMELKSDYDAEIKASQSPHTKPSM